MFDEAFDFTARCLGRHSGLPARAVTVASCAGWAWVRVPLPAKLFGLCDGSGSFSRRHSGVLAGGQAPRPLPSLGRARL